LTRRIGHNDPDVARPDARFANPDTGVGTPIMNTDTGDVNTGDVDLVGKEAVRNLARAALFAALVGAGAYVSFPNPFAPGVPVTLQVLAVFLTGIFLGAVWGGASMALYVVAGAAGAPVFAGGNAGVGVLLGNTAGYVWAFPVAVVVLGAIVHGGLEPSDPSDAGVPRLVAGMLLATAIVYAGGALGGMATQGIGPVAATQAYAAPFVPAEAFKIAAAVGIVRSDAIRAA
jgi:biotin transport system substrate-specific component